MVPTIYGYNGHNLSSVTDANGQTWLQNTYTNNRVTTQTYGGNPLTISYDTANRMATETNRRDVIREVIYNSNGQEEDEKVYTNLGCRTTDPEYYWTNHYYNSSLLRTETIFPSDSAIDYTYDAKGNISAIYVKTKYSDLQNGSDPNVIKTSFIYDSTFNFVKTITDPCGNVTTYDYNPTNGNLEKITYPQISTPTGNVNPTVTFTYNTNGQILTMKTPDKMITEYVYGSNPSDVNNFGRLVKVIIDSNTVGLNLISQYKYDRIGRAIEVNDPCNNVTKYVHNAMDQLRKSVLPSPFNNVTKYNYNKAKKLSKVEREITGDPNQIIAYTYNILDKIKTVSDPCNYVTKLGYDEGDNLADANDAENNKTQHVYDERDLLWKTTDANGGVTEYSYTLNGKLAQIKDANQVSTYYQYDGFDRLKKIVYPNATYEEYWYDKKSNITKYRNRGGQITNYTYDAMNWLRTKIMQLPVATITYRYDAAGRVYDVVDSRAVAEGGGTTRYYYDRAGRVSQVTDIKGRNVYYQYNKMGLRNKLTYPDNSYVNYQYDNLGRLKKLKYHDSQNDREVNYNYDELGRRTSIVYPFGYGIVYDYDIANKLKKITNTTDSGTKIYEYKYDKVGNKKRCKIDNNNAYAYTYDKLYQLTYIDYNDASHTQSIMYDKLGNRRVFNDSGTVTGYRTNKLNQYTAVGTTNYTYDPNGNLTNDGTYSYTYDCENRLVKAVWNNYTTYSNKYDFMGKRVRYTRYDDYNPGEDLSYTYDGQQVICVYNSIGGLEQKYVFGDRLDEPLFVFEGRSPQFHFYDGIGSVVKVGQGGTYISYDAFGSGDYSYQSLYSYTGREQNDSLPDLVYYRARHYKPSIGRFLQPDPIGYADSMNLYTYCRNNPMRYVDPRGLWTVTVGGAYGFGVQFSVGHNEGQWSVTANIGLGLGGIVEYDSASTGRSAVGDGFGFNGVANLSGEVKGLFGASGGIGDSVTVGANGVSLSPEVSGSVSVGPIGGTGHLGAEAGITYSGDPISEGDASAGVSVGVGAMGFVGFGVHGQCDSKGSAKKSKEPYEPYVDNMNYYP